MKLPRWVVVSMLVTSALLLVIGGMLWWVTWPERTVNEFVRLMAANDLDTADAMSSVDLSLFALASHTDHPLPWSDVRLTPLRRGPADFLLAQQAFKTEGLEGVLIHVEEMRVRRGHIVKVDAWGVNPLDIFGFGPKMP